MCVCSACRDWAGDLICARRTVAIIDRCVLCWPNRIKRLIVIARIRIASNAQCVTTFLMHFSVRWPAEHTRNAETHTNAETHSGSWTAEAAEHAPSQSRSGHVNASECACVHTTRSRTRRVITVPHTIILLRTPHTNTHTHTHAHSAEYEYEKAVLCVCAARALLARIVCRRQPRIQIL